MERRDANHLLRSGFDLSLDEAVAAEARVEAAANPIEERILLVVFYWSRSCTSDRFAESWCRHVIAVIRDDPTAELLGIPFFAGPASRSQETLTNVRDEWLKQMDLHPTSVPVLDNAASFFWRFDPPVADRLFRRASELDGDEGGWAYRRALLLSSQIADGLTDRNLIEARITELERTCFGPTDDKGRSYLFGELAACAYNVGLDRSSVRLALISVNAAQPSRGSDGFDDPLHEANILLGRMAMRSGDSQQAARYLLNAANICQSEHPEPLGPDVVLAGELLGAGEKDAVADYFTTCASHWAEGGAMLAGWADDIQHGKTPELPDENERRHGRVVSRA